LSWQLRIPYRDRDQRLTDPGVLELPRALQDVISIVGRDGKPQLVPASSTPWWKEDEEIAYGVGKAFDKSQLPIRIKTFEC
jgi:hypothetical protein